MDDTGNVIAAYNSGNRLSVSDFDALMKKTNYSMNNIALTSSLYTSCDPKQLEIETFKEIQRQCEGTPFNPKDIELVSGLSFPDIVASSHFGVEVKCTKQNKWTSTGSSIVESTRVQDVEHIYMLFGKLGGAHAEFKCKPYQDCLSDIAVTHSPRYLIDMEIGGGMSIFEKMRTDYNSFRLSEDPISQVRKYYLEKIKREKRSAMPWWIGGDSTTSATLRLWSSGSLSQFEQMTYRALILIIFPEDVCRSLFDRPALWLCVRHSIINTHFRDLFTAGGQQLIDGMACPRIVRWFLDLAPRVGNILNSEEYDDILQDLQEYNPSLISADDKYSHWADQVSVHFPKVHLLRKWLKEQYENP